MGTVGRGPALCFVFHIFHTTSFPSACVDLHFRTWQGSGRREKIAGLHVHYHPSVAVVDFPEKVEEKQKWIWLVHSKIT